MGTIAFKAGSAFSIFSQWGSRIQGSMHCFKNFIY